MTVRSPHISILLFICLICERVNFEYKITLAHEIRQSSFLMILNGWPIAGIPICE